MIRKCKSVLLVLSGPSGVGKSAVRAALEELLPDLPTAVSCTTRKPRPGEKDGREYHFISPAEFERKVEAGEFLEWAQVAGNLYGTPKSEVEQRLEKGEDLLFEVDVQGGRNLKSAYPETVLVFLLPPSLEALETRLKGRSTETEAERARRLELAHKELEIGFSEYDYLVVNDRVERAAEQVAAIFLAESARRTRNCRWENGNQGS